MSAAAFSRKFPTGKIPRSSPFYNKTFICRRGCNARTTTYTSEFIWENIFSGSSEDIAQLKRLVESGTKSTRRQPKSQTAADDALTEYSGGQRSIKKAPENEETDQQEETGWVHVFGT